MGATISNPGDGKNPTAYLLSQRQRLVKPLADDLRTKSRTALEYLKDSLDSEILSATYGEPVLNGLVAIIDELFALQLAHGHLFGELQMLIDREDTKTQSLTTSIYLLDSCNRRVR